MPRMEDTGGHAMDTTSMTRRMQGRWWLAGPLLLALSCSHDAPRDNPLDPQLTPPVELQVALDDTAGTATLRWTRYEGEQAFAAYWVLRNELESTRVETLAVVTEAGRTVLVDTLLAVDTPYRYRVSTINAARHEAPSEPQVIRALGLPAVVLTGVGLDSRTASTTLTWTPYHGPRFHAYQVRRSVGEDVRTVATVGDLVETSFVDTGLVGNTEYSYQILVLTTRGETVPSATMGGLIHALVDTWPVPLQGERAAREYVRLYPEPGNRISALITGGDRVRLLEFTPDGQLEAERIPLGFVEGGSIDARMIAQALGSEGQRFLSIGFHTVPYRVAVMHLGDDGMPATVSHELFADAIPGVLDEAETAALGELALRCGQGCESYFDNVTVTARGAPVFEDDFGSLPDGRIEEDWGSWVLSGERVQGRNGWLAVGSDAAVRATGSQWQDFTLELDVVVTYRARIELGGEVWSRFALDIESEAETVTMEWSFQPPPGSDMEPRTATATDSFPFINGVSYHLILGMTDGHFSASIEAPEIWVRASPTDAPSWASLAPIGDQLALTVDATPLTLTWGEEAVERTALISWVGETRVWQTASGGYHAGVCLPEADEVRWGSVLRASSWQAGLRTTVGPRLGERAGHMFYPVSLAAGPEGRVYVLDAGNSRVLVFNADGRYITQWGKRGSEDGLFDLGDGGKMPKGLDFSGSICVDDEGYIYVADVHNRRIQRFAP